MPGHVGQVVQQLAVAVQAQGETADQVVFRGLQFGFGRAFRDKGTNHLPRHLQGLIGLVGPGLQAHGKRPGVQARGKIAVDAVAQAALFTHLLCQARHKTTAAQNVIAHGQRKKVRVVALVAGLPHEHVGLRRVERHAHSLGLRQRWHFGHCRQRRARLARRQPCQQLQHTLLCLGTVQGTDHAHAGTAAVKVARMKGAHVGHLNGIQARFVGFVAIGVSAMHRCSKTALCHGAGAGVRLFQRCQGAVPLDRPDRRRKAGLRQLASGQSDGTLQQIGHRQRAQEQAQAVTAGAGRKQGAQIGPGFTQGVLVQCRLIALGGNAFGQHARRGAGQARLTCRVATRPCIKVDLNVDHGQRGALHQVDAGAIGRGPVLNGQAGPKAAGRQQARHQRQTAQDFVGGFHRAPSPCRKGMAGLRGAWALDGCGNRWATVKLSSPK